MAALVASPTVPVPYTPTTITGSGFALNTPLNLVVVDADGTNTYPVTSDGAGAFTTTVVCNDPSQFVANVYLVTPASLATLSFNSTD
jgi:hypothetical protein